MKLNLPSTRLGYQEFYDSTYGPDDYEWYFLKNMTDEFYYIPYASTSQGDLGDYIVLFLQVRYTGTSSKEKELRFGGKTSVIRLTKDLELEKEIKFKQQGKFWSSSISEAPVNVSELVKKDGRFQDLILCCIPRHVLENEESPNEPPPTYKKLLDMMNKVYEYDPWIPAKKTGVVYSKTQRLVKNIETLVSWGTIFFPLTDSSLFFEHSGIPKTKLDEMKTVRSYLIESFVMQEWEESEDLKIVKAFLDDPMDEDAFEYLAEYIFPALIEKGELPSNFPLNYSDFIAFLSNFSDLILDTIGSINSAVSSVSPEAKADLKKAVQSYLRKSFKEINCTP